MAVISLKCWFPKLSLKMKAAKHKNRCTNENFLVLVSVNEIGRLDNIQLFSKSFIDSDFCHYHLHTLCTYYWILTLIKRCKSLFSYVLLKHMYSTVTTKHFISKLISFPAKIWHVI